MKRSDCMTVGELKENLKDLPDDAVIMITAECKINTALAVHPYQFCTSLDDQNVYLLTQDTTESVSFVEY